MCWIHLQGHQTLCGKFCIITDTILSMTVTVFKHLLSSWVSAPAILIFPMSSREGTPLYYSTVQTSTLTFSQQNQKFGCTRAEMSSWNTCISSSIRRLLLCKDTKLNSPRKVGLILSQCFKFADRVIVTFLLKFSSEKICPFVYEPYFICCVLNVQCLSIIDTSVFCDMQFRRKNS